MSARTNYALVGVFVLLFGTALIGVVLWLSSGAPGRAYDEYVVYMAESVSGLSRDSAVKYYGVDVGRVHDIALGPTETQRVKLMLTAEPRYARTRSRRWRPRDSRASRTST